MIGNQSNGDPKPSKSLTRRAFLPWLMLGVSGLNVALIWAFRRSSLSEPPQKYRLKPRFRISGKKLGSAPKLTPGFYLNPKSQVIHYVPEGKKPRFTGRIIESRLQPKDPTEVPIEALKPSVSTLDVAQSAVPKSAVTKTAVSKSVDSRPARPPRVNPARASYSFEQAAVSEIKQNNVDRGCDLLMYAIKYDQQYGVSWAPSLRLYDLLAGVAVRFNKMDYLVRLTALIENTRDPAAVKHFAERVKKWRDPESRWHLRWSNRSKQIEWKVDQFIGLVF